MTMMYKRIAAAIRDAGLQAHPTDFLQVGLRGGATGEGIALC
jgi:hypothetical protein